MFKLTKKTKDRNPKSNNLINESTIDFDENQIKLLSDWLDDLNNCDLIHLTNENHLILMVGGKVDLNQQIFIYSKHIDFYMKNRLQTTNQYPIVLQMSDIAKILIQFNYIKQISGQWVFPLHSISLGYQANIWLKSMIENISLNNQYEQIDVEISNGAKVNKFFSIPYQCLSPTTNLDLIVDFLIQNGQIQYNLANDSYIYHFIEPDLFVDKQIKSKEKQNDHQFLSYHLINYSIDQMKQIIQCQFRYEKNSFLILSNEFYKQIEKEHFNRHYLIDLLISNGNFSSDRTIFYFNKEKYFLLTNEYETIYFSLNEKRKLIENFLHLIIQMDSVKFDQEKQILVLENDIDLKKLFFTFQHSNFIVKNHFKKQDVQQILIDHSIIKKDHFNHFYLFYNQQFIQIPNILFDSFPNPNRNSIEQLIDYMYHHQLITFDQQNSLIKLHFIDQTLLLPLSHLHSIIDQNLLLLNNRNILPFTSEQLTNWLIQNSYLTKKNR